MNILRIATFLLAVVGSAVVSIGSDARPQDIPAGGAPELAVAVIVDARTIEVHRFVVRTVTRSIRDNATARDNPQIPNGGREFSATETARIVETHINSWDISTVVVRRIDGRAMSHNLLLRKLASPTPVVVVDQGPPVNPLCWKMFKPESLVLDLSKASAPRSEKTRDLPTSTTYSSSPVLPGPSENTGTRN